MKPVLTITLTILLSAAFSGAYAQDFKKQQQSQERTIKAAKRNNKITDREYEKLMKEQLIIRETIAGASEDGIWTAREKNAVSGKLGRAGRRLHRYKTNGEVY